MIRNIKKRAGEVKVRAELNGTVKALKTSMEINNKMRDEFSAVFSMLCAITKGQDTEINSEDLKQMVENNPFSGVGLHIEGEKMIVRFTKRVTESV